MLMVAWLIEYYYNGDLYFSPFHTTTESVREMYRYGDRKAPTGKGQLDAEINRMKNKFRAERNFYMTGFALFLMM